jgi:hypothetical protein
MTTGLICKGRTKKVEVGSQKFQLFHSNNNIMNLITSPPA